MRRSHLAILAVLATLFAGVGLWLLPSPPQTAETPASKPSDKTKLHPRATRISLPAPRDIERPELPRDRPEQAEVTADDRRAMNYAVDAVLKAAQADCINPWLAEMRPDEPRPAGEIEAEFVFDAVLYDGRMVDFGFRSLTLDLPQEVLSCVADRAWYADWPEWDLRGELRLQRASTVRTRP